MDKREELLRLLGDDPLSLLDVPVVDNRQVQENSVLHNNFEEICDFVEEKGYEPSSNLNDVNEFKLYCRLKAIRSNPEMVKILLPSDILGLLRDCKELTLDDVLSQDPLGLLDEDYDASILTLRNVSSSGRINPDYVARRRKCKDFDEYKPLFDTLHEELESGKRKLVVYSPDRLKAGGFYVLNGILLYLKSIDGEVSRHDFSSGTRNRFDGRTVCVFDNGTMSDMLYRSLDKALQKDGYCISDIIDIEHHEASINQDDQSNGYIYVLSSLHPKFKGMDNIYKIGCTKSSVSERIKNSKNEATYLYADVEVVATYRCYNISVFDVEQAIHSFLDSVRLDIVIPDDEGNLQRPKEWFAVSLDIIEEIVQLLQDNSLSQYLYDKRSNKILKRE